MNRRTTAELKKEIARQIKAGGIARLDLTAEEYASIRDTPALRKHSHQVIAAPARLAKGDSPIGEATIARCCWVRIPYKSPEPELIEWHSTQAEANARAAELQAESPAAVVKVEQALRTNRTRQIFGDYKPKDPEGRNAWAVHRWDAGAYMQRYLVAYNPIEVMGVMRSLVNLAYCFAIVKPAQLAVSAKEGKIKARDKRREIARDKFISRREKEPAQLFDKTSIIAWVAKRTGYSKRAVWGYCEGLK
jgi:hypothetical protein